MTPQFSVLLPCYNGEAYIESAIESLRGQTLQDFEVLAIDDGSTDGSGEILHDLAGRFDLMSVQCQSNKGLSAARNAAVAKASGEWIVMLDADDLFSPRRLELLAETISQFPDSRFIFHDSYRIDATGGRERSTHVHRRTAFTSDLKRFRTALVGEHWILSAEIWQHILCRYTWMLPITLCVHRSVVEQLDGPFDESLRVTEDVDFCVRCIQRVDQVLYRDRPLSSYRIHESSMTHDARFAMRQTDFYNKMKKQHFTLLAAGYRQALSEKIARHYGGLYYAFRREGHRVAALSSASQAFREQRSGHHFLSILKSFLPTRE